MPVLGILDKDGTLRWDAPGVLEATIYFPDRPDLRAGYEARWRAEHKLLVPAAKRLTKKTTHEPAKIFGTTTAKPMKGVLRKRRERIERIGAALWLQAALSMIDPPTATENKVSYVLEGLGRGDLVTTSRSTIKRDWAIYRGVIHWCAATSYQRRVYRAPLCSHPGLGPPEYSVYAALFDFLAVGQQFFAFARKSGGFAETEGFKPVRDLWTLPAGLSRLAPLRDKSWPDCNRIRADVLPDASILEELRNYDATLFRAGYPTD